jgi:hypothetical protein
MIISERVIWARHIARIWGEEECMHGAGGKATRKETTRKT